MRISITSRKRRRVQRDGSVKHQIRFIVSYRHPRTLKRMQRFFSTRADAESARDRLLVNAAQGVPPPTIKNLTVGAVIEAWLKAKEGSVEARTLHGYRQKLRYAAPLEPLFVTDVTPAELRTWLHGVAKTAGHYSASKCKVYVGAALRMAAEDHNLRLPNIPALGPNRHKKRHAILTLEQVGQVLRQCEAEPRGMYAALPLLTGMRPGEALGLLWSEVDLDRRVIRVRRTQHLDGRLIETTKTESGLRDIPIGPLLYEMLVRWRERCPRLNGRLHRVLPAQLGGPMYSPAFLAKVWHPILARAGVPKVRPYSARHSWISGLQAAGAEIAVASRLAGHASPATTVGTYTHALRGGEKRRRSARGAVRREGRRYDACSSAIRSRRRAEPSPSEGT